MIVRVWKILECATDRLAAFGGTQVRAELKPLVLRVGWRNAKFAHDDTEDGGEGEEVGYCEGGSVHVAGRLFNNDDVFNR